MDRPPRCAVRAEDARFRSQRGTGIIGSGSGGASWQCPALAALFLSRFRSAAPHSQPAQPRRGTEVDVTAPLCLDESDPGGWTAIPWFRRNKPNTATFRSVAT